MSSKTLDRLLSAGRSLLNDPDGLRALHKELSRLGYGSDQYTFKFTSLSKTVDVVIPPSFPHKTQAIAFIHYQGKAQNAIVQRSFYQGLDFREWTHPVFFFKPYSTPWSGDVDFDAIEAAGPELMREFLDRWGDNYLRTDDIEAACGDLFGEGWRERL